MSCLYVFVTQCNRDGDDQHRNTPYIRMSSSNMSKSAALIRLGRVLRPLQLYLKPFGSNLEAMHRLDGRLGRTGVIVGNETETFGQIGLFINEHFGRYHIAEGQKS